MLNIHGEACKNQDIVTCPICGRMMNKRIVLFSHLRSHENAEALEEAFDLWNKWPEKKRVGSKMPIKFSCKYCLIPHTNQHSFLTHMKSQHPNKGRFSKYTCQYCKVSEFDSMKHFLIHLRTTHQTEYYGHTIKWTLSNPLKQTEGRPKGQCDVCKKMIDVYYLPAHKERRHGKKEKINSDYSVKPSPSNGDNIYSCPIPDCYTRCKNRQQLKSHFILHLENNPFVCKFPGCNVKCDAQCHLDRHMKLHTSPLPTCTKCGVSFSRIDKLRNHACIFDATKLRYDEHGHLRHKNSNARLTRVQPVNAGNVEKADTGIKQEMDCDGNEDAERKVQPKGIDNSERKRYRKRICINSIIAADPIFLEVCKQNPGFKDLILGRKDMKGKKVAAKTFQCPKCSTVFHGKNALRMHSDICSEQMDEHSEVVTKNVGYSVVCKVGCPICGASFSNNELMESHIESDHAPSEIFRCSVCSRVFSNKKSKDRHYAKVHEKPSQVLPEVACSKCDKVLANSSSLARHWLLIHGVRLTRPAPDSSVKKKLKSKKSTNRKRRNATKETKTKKTKTNQSYKQRSPKKLDDSINKLDYSIVKVEPDLNIDASDDDMNMTNEVPQTETYIKTETQ